MAFISGPDGDLKTAFVSDSWLLDQFVGNRLFTWGTNSSGEIGDNTVDNWPSAKSSPVQTVAGGINWKSVSCGSSHKAAIKTDGTLWCWGSNSTLNTMGALGDNTINDRSSPVQTVTFGTNWKQVSCGFYNTLAIKTDGTLWGWGYNTYGNLGDNTSTRRSSPVQTIAGGTNWKQVSGGYRHTAAIKTDGTLWTWGRNSYGQLGDNTIDFRSSPVQTIAGGTNWKQVACGQYHIAAVKTDGTLWNWGKDDAGQLGDNEFFATNKSSPVQTVAFGTNWKSVACGWYYTAAIKADGTLWLWGQNNGNLGDNTIGSKLSPVQTVTFGTNWKQVTCCYANTAAIKTDGTLWCWGTNYNGQLGDNTTIPRSSPVQTIVGGTNWKQVAMGGGGQTAAVTNGDI